MRGILAFNLGTLAASWALLVATSVEVLTDTTLHFVVFCSAVAWCVLAGVLHPKSRHVGGGEYEGNLLDILKTSHRWAAALMVLSIVVFAGFVARGYASGLPEGEISVNAENLATYPMLGEIWFAACGLCSGIGVAVSSSSLRIAASAGL